MSSTYYNMTDPTGDSGFLPTVTFTSTDSTFTSTQRTAQLAEIGVTGYYEADFADNITTIIENAFSGDEKVVVVTIKQVTTIGASAFDGCTALRAITLDCAVDGTGRYKLTSIGTYAFQNCTSLRNLHIPDTVKIIPEGMCKGCTSLEVAVMGYGVATRISDDNYAYTADGSIGASAFSGGTLLSYFVVPETVGSIGSSAFANCSSMAYFAILGRPTVSNDAFTGAMDTSAVYIYDMSANDPNSEGGNRVDLSANTIPSDLSANFPSNSTKRPYQTYGLAPSSGSTVLMVSNITSIVPIATYWWKGQIASTVTTIEYAGFKHQNIESDRYTKMIGVSFPTTLTALPYEAFGNGGVSGCIVSAFYIPKSVDTYDLVSNNAYTFYNGPGVSNTDLSETKQFVFQSGSTGITSIPPYMFNYSAAKAIIIPPTVTTVENYGFSDAIYLQLINIFQKNAKSELHTTLVTGFWGMGASVSGKYLYFPKTLSTTGNFTFHALNDSTKIYYYPTNYNSVGYDNGLVFNDTYTFFMIIEGDSIPSGLKIPLNNFHVLFSPTMNTIISNTFNSKPKLKSISIPDSVTIINQNAFNGCTGLVNVWLSPTSNLSSIGAGAFRSCTALISIFIPNSVRIIYESAFYICTSLSSVTFGDNPGLKYIDSQAFKRCTGTLRSIRIPASVIYIGDSVFICEAEVNNLTTVTFDAGSRLRAIGSYCFGYLDNTGATFLNNMVLPSSLQFTGTTQVLRNISTRAYSENFVLPSSLTYLSESMLYRDTIISVTKLNIRNIYFPVSITSLPGPRRHYGYKANSYSLNLMNESSVSAFYMYLPSGVSNALGQGITTYLNTNRTRSYYETVEYSGTNGTLTTLDLSNNVANTTDATNTTQVHADILDSVIVVGNGANSIAGDGSYNLISVNIPNTVTDISQDAFRGCGALVYVTFSEGSHLTTIGPSAFQDCSMIHDIQLPNSLTTIGANAFNGCTNLATISIPYNVTSMEAGAFHNTSGLLDVSGSSVRIHEHLYNDISGTLSTYFTDPSQISLNVVPELLLTNTLHPSSLTISQINNIYIRYRQSQLGFPKIAVNGSDSGGTLQTTDIYNTILASGGGFVHLDISASSIPANAFKDNLNIYSVSIGASLTDISNYAFSGCTNLSYLSFHPDSTCTTIGESAFNNNALYDLALPDSLTTIGQYCFQSSTQLTAVCIPNKVTNMGNNAFGECTKLVSIAVPSNTYNSNTYFTTSGTTLPSTRLVYNSSSPYNSIPHFKLSDYSIPTGIIQNVIPSGVTYIDHRAYAYYPEISIYAINIPQTSGRFSYVANGVEMPIMPAAYLLNGTSVTSNATFPVFRSVPDLNVYSVDIANTDKIDDTDNFYILMPGYSICIYNNLYDEENLFTDVSTYRYFDNEFGQVPLNIDIGGADNTTSSILILYNGCIVNKKFYN